MTTTRTRYGAAGLAGLLAIAGLTAGPALAQVQDKDQKNCITALNKAGGKVAATQGKENANCVKNAGKGTEADATTCLTDDDKGKVAKAATKVDTAFTKKCTTPPDFGPDNATTTSDAGKDEALGVANDLFGSDVTGAMVLSSVDSDAAKCQATIVKRAHKLADTIVKDFGKCKKDGLKEDDIDTAARLAACIDTVNEDLKGKVAKATDKLEDDLSDRCGGLDLEATFPGACVGYTDFTACVVDRVRCRACSALSVMDNLGTVCDGFEDGLPSNESCGLPLLTSEFVSLPSIEAAETPGTTGVVVTNAKLLTQFPPSGPDLNRANYVRWRLDGPEVAPDAILILVPGFGSGVNPLRTMAEELIPRMLADKDFRLEVWGFSRRDDLLEDREGTQIGAAEKDPSIVQDWYYGAELGLTLHSSLVAGPNRRAVFYNSQDDIPFLASFTPDVFSHDIDAVVEAALLATPNVFLGGHSAGTGFTARYASTDLDTGPGVEAGYAKLRGLVLLEGGGGSSTTNGPLSADTLDRIIAKADGGLFGAVRDNAARCVDGTTLCTIATEAVDCIGQLPPKCTLPTTSYTSIGGLEPQIYAAAEVGAVQALTDPETGQFILQVDQGAPGNNAIDVVPGLAPLQPPLMPAATVDGAFGIFLDDDYPAATFLSPALATSLGEQGQNKNGLATWKDINDAPTSNTNTPNNGPMPTTLPPVRWGQEVEVTRIDRHRHAFIAGGENASDWYYAGSGLSTLSVSGLCSVGTCTVGKAGACATNSDCSQSISLDSTALSATRPDIANLTQAANIDIPVISFGGSNGLTPVGASFLSFAQSIGTCAAASCDGTDRVVDELLPNPAFPTYGDVDGGYEVYISEGYAHVDVVTAEDTPENLIPERLADFLERNSTP